VKKRAELTRPSPRQLQFTDPSATDNAQRFYRVRSLQRIWMVCRRKP